MPFDGSAFSPVAEAPSATPTPSGSSWLKSLCSLLRLDAWRDRLPQFPPECPPRCRRADGWAAADHRPWADRAGGKVDSTAITQRSMAAIARWGRCEPPRCGLMHAASAGLLTTYFATSCASAASAASSR